MSKYTIASEMAVIDYPTRVAVAAEWLPLLGSNGFALYSLYAALLALGVEIGERKLASHLASSKTTIQRYNRLLELAGLVRIEKGGPTSASRVILSEPRHVTPEIISQLYADILADNVLNATHAQRFRQAVFGRLENYESLYSRLDAHTLATLSRPPQAAQVAQNGGHGRPAAPTPAPTITAEKIATSERILSACDVTGANLSRCAQHDPVVVFAVCIDALMQKKLDNPAGYIVTNLRPETPAPPITARTLAGALLRMSERDFFILAHAAETAYSWDDLPEDFYPELDEYVLNFYRELNERNAPRIAAALGFTD